MTSMTAAQQFSLKWNNYAHHITYAFDSLRSHEDLVDVTLCCEGRKIRAHKVLLSACSTYFRDVFKENPCQHPVIVFKNVKYDDLMAIVEFMYQGEVNVQQESLPSFLNTAEMLAVQGLTDGDGSVPPKKEPAPMATVATTAASSSPNIIAMGVAKKPIKLEKITYTTTTIATTPTTVMAAGTTYAIDPLDQSSIQVSPAAKRQFSTTESIESSDSQEKRSRYLSHDNMVQCEDLEDDNVEEVDDGYTENENLEQQNDNNQAAEDSSAHYLKMELPEFIDIDNQAANKNITAETTVTKEADQTIYIKEDDEEDSYKAIDEQDMELIYHQPQRLSSIMSIDMTTIGTSSDRVPVYTTQQSSDIKPASQQQQQPQILTASGPFVPGTDITSQSTECELCNRKFTSISAYRRHHESKHTDIQVCFACSICSKLFKTKWSLSTHVSRFHRAKHTILVNSSGGDDDDGSSSVRKSTGRTKIAKENKQEI